MFDYEANDETINNPKIILKLTFLEFASLIGLLLYLIWRRLWLSVKALVL
jgi:hypothetical protein